MGMSEYIVTEGVWFRYADDGEEILKDINLKVNKGEFLAVLGHNGCGKSTLAKLFNALILPHKGRVLVNGTDTQDEDKRYEVRRQVGLVLQNPDNQIVASIVEEDVAFGPENLGVSPQEIRKRVDTALKTVGMLEYKNHSSYRLSGGQKQRIAIAGMLAMQPECIVLDEPTSMLDPGGRDEVLETIMRLNREKGITVVLITHFMDEAVLADRVVVMDKGRILLEGKSREVFSQVELLRKHELSVPQGTELVYRLKQQKFRVPEGVLTQEECIAAVVGLLEDEGCL